jgi:hypothetical protein
MSNALNNYVGGSFDALPEHSKRLLRHCKSLYYKKYPSLRLTPCTSFTVHGLGFETCCSGVGIFSVRQPDSWVDLIC